MTKTRTNTKDPFAARLRHSTSAWMRENVSVSEYMTENSSNHMAFVCMIEDLNIINSIKNRENNKYVPLSLSSMDDLEEYSVENTTTPVGMPSRHIITCTTITIADMTTTTSNNNHLMCQRFYFLPSLHKYVLHELVHFNTNYSTPIELRYHHDFGHQSLHTNPDLILMQCPILMTCLVGAKISFDAQSQLFDRGNSHPQERRNGIRMPLLLLLISTAAKDQVIEIDSVLSAISQILTCDDEWYTWRVEVGERWDEFVDVAEGGFNKLDEGEFDSTVCVWDNGERIGLDTAPDLIARTLTAGAINTSSAPTHDPTHDFAFKLLFVVSVKPLVSYVFASYPCAIVKLGVTALTRHLQIVVLLRTDPMGVFCPIQVAACVGLFAIKSAPHDVISRVAFLAHVDIPLCILVTQCLAKYPLANEIRDSFIATSVTLWGEFLCDQVYTDEMLQTITIRHEMLPTITIRHCRNEKLRTTLKTIMVMERGWGVTDNMAVDVAIGWRAAVIITCVYTLAKELIAMLLPSIHYHPLMVLIHAHTVMGHDRPTVGKCGTARQSSVHASNAIVDIYHYRVEAHTMHIVLVYNCRHDTNRSLHLQSTDMGTEGIFHTLRECCISTEIIARFTHRLNYVYDALDNEGNSDAVEDLIIYSDDDDDERTPHTDRFYRPLNYGEQSVTYKAIVCLALVATRHCWLRLCEVGLALNDPANNSAGTNPITTSPSIHDLVDDEQHAVLDAFPMIDCADDYMGLGISGWLIVENISMGAMMPCMLLSGEVFVRVKRLYRLLRNAAATNLPTHMFTTPLIKEICYVSESCSDGDVAVVVAMSTLCDLHIVGRAKIDDRLSSVSAATTPLGGVFSANGIITDVHTFCHDVSVSADAAPVDDIHILLGTSTVDCVDERSGLVSRMGVITGWIAAENIIINAMMKRMLLWGEIWYDCFNSEMFGYSIVGITGNHWRLLILTWLPPVHLSGFVMMDFVDEHDRLAPSVIAVSGWKDTLKPTVAGGEREESTVKMILFWGEQYGCLADDKEVIGISALYGSQSYGEIELCIGVQNTVYSWGAVYVVIPQTDTVMITDLRVSDVPVGLQPSADDTITCVHMPRSKVSGHYCSELSDSNHRLRVLTSMWSPISTSVALHDILDSVIDPSYDDDNSDGLVIPCFTAYSNSVASSHKKRLSLIDCINWRTEHTSQQDDMIGLGDHSAQLKDGLHQPVSWGARYNRYPDYESDYDILAGVDVFDDRVVDNYFFCGCDDDGSMFDMDEDSMQYDTGAGYDTRVDLLCITTDTPADGHVMIDGNSYLQVTILDTRFAADRAFTGTMVCRCADLFCEETLSSRYTPLDVEIYAVRTTLEKTMIKSTSHCLEVLFQGQSTSPGYDDPTTTEDILFARRRPMFLTSVVDDKLRHDMVNSKSYVVITHDCLHKHHCMLIHHCITGCAASSTGQREHITISAGYNYGDVLSKIWTYYRDAWILLLGELVWKRDMMDLALFNRI